MNLRSGDQSADDRGRGIGSMIAAGFGSAYVVINSSVPEPWGVPRWALVGLAVAVALVIIVRSLRLLRYSTGSPTGASPFGRAFAALTVAEVLAIAVGVRVVADVFGRPDLGVSWVTFVVGAHFFVLARLFQVRAFHLLGALLVMAALVGAALGLVGVPLAPALISGVLSGAILLGFGLWGTRRPLDVLRAATNLHQRQRIGLCPGFRRTL